MKNALIVLMLSIASVIIVNIHCQRNMLSPISELPEEFLQSQPDTLIIGEQKLVLRTYLWRDFMPIIPPGGKPLYGVIMVETVDSSAIEFDIDSDIVYLIHNHSVWPVHYDEVPEDHPDQRPFRLLKIFRSGPKLEPRILVDVVVRLLIDEHRFYLRATDQFINVTF